MQRSDLIIIGGGIVGLATAYRFLERFSGKTVTVLEKENAVAKHQTGRNSGVLHSGVYYRPGSLRALNCRLGDIHADLSRAVQSELLRILRWAGMVAGTECVGRCRMAAPPWCDMRCDMRCALRFKPRPTPCAPSPVCARCPGSLAS